ncbi:MAG TPA: 7-carboxy-7-deazaguanine synthase QueE [Polyangiaceae bacterium]|jgi:organic radical activating enzyme|nr:7-carboxy-7-deazaguanine synthase QueE [Polyangiaceae bacterium]
MAAVLRVSEVFDSLQGEGPSAGLPATFLRLALCNLRCGYCDTKYTWDWQSFRYEEQVRAVEVPSLAPRLAAASGERLIITGGEPLVQLKALERLLPLLPSVIAIEVETNGTLRPSASLLARVTQWNVSPKLGNSGQSESDRLNMDALACLRDSGRAWLKFVVGDRADCEEAQQLALRCEWPRERVSLMPLASSRAEHALRAPLIAAQALTRKLGYSPRLHIELWDGQRGV